MKVNYNRLCTLTQFATQAIQTTTKATAACLTLSLSLSLSLSVTSGFGQCNHTSNSLQQKVCRTTYGGSINDSILQVLDVMGGNVSNGFYSQGVKDPTRVRSVFLNGKINGGGGFATIYTSQNKFFTNHNQQGSVFATDVDGDCDYEGEDSLISYLVTNGFNEINMYNIDHILQHDSVILDSASTSNITNLSSSRRGWDPTTPNHMLEQERAEYHLLRFVHKAKTNGLNVNFVIYADTLDKHKAKKFYHHNLKAGGELPQYPLHEVCQKYQEVAFNGMYKMRNEDFSAPYLYYETIEDDMLIFPRDSDRRISHWDKMIIDIYNYHIFNLRVQYQLISPSSNSCTGIINASNCTGTCDAMLFEYEWWNHQDSVNESTFYPDEELKMLKELVEFSKCFPNDKYHECTPKVYGVADVFDRSLDTNGANWFNTDPNMNEQARANLIDNMYDRIYLYSYHKNPCDCYNGKNTTKLEKKFFHKVSLLANNNRGALIGSNGEKETEIFPVFHAEHHETDTTSVYYYARRRHYEIDTIVGYQTLGCEGESETCDYCNDYAGRFMNDLGAHIADATALDSTAGYRLGFVENIFRYQYDLDPATSAPQPNGKNQLNGYCWFKSGTLRLNGISGKTHYNGLEEKKKEVLHIFPNPAIDELWVDYGSVKVRDLYIYDISGKVMLYNTVGDGNIRVSHLPKGIYFLTVIGTDNRVFTQKFIKE